MTNTVKNPVYPLSLNLILDYLDESLPEGPRRREYLQDVSSDLLTFDRKQPFPRIDQEVDFGGKTWKVAELRNDALEGAEPVDWVLLLELS
jgi:hypothetical protein